MIRTMDGVGKRIRRLIRRLSTPLEHESLEFRQTDPKELVEETLKMTGIAELPNIQFQKELEAVPAVSVASAEIQKVIQNLIINATEAIEGKGEVQVRLDQHGLYVRIEVRDTGCGMSRDYMQNSLFKPFRTSKPKGLGIGLYQCKAIVEAHRGRIEVESTQGVGSQFRVLLPLQKLGK